MKIAHTHPPPENLIYGYHPVHEALQAHRGRVEKVILSHGRHDSRIREILDLARVQHVPVIRVEPSLFRRAYGGKTAQSVAAQVAVRAYDDPDSLLANASATPLFVIVDEITDPRNLGSIIRSAAAAGVDGVFVPSRRVAPLSAVVEKASAGAVNRVKIARAENIANMILRLDESSVQTIGLVPDAPLCYLDCDLTRPTAIIAGGEEKGVRRLIRERCTRLVAIPMAGGLDSLNVAVATAVVLYEALRQRRALRS